MILFNLLINKILPAILHNCSTNESSTLTIPLEDILFINYLSGKRKNIILPKINISSQKIFNLKYN